jgi:hypothetical protein
LASSNTGHEAGSLGQVVGTEQSGCSPKSPDYRPARGGPDKQTDRSQAYIGHIDRSNSRINRLRCRRTEVREVTSGEEPPTRTQPAAGGIAAASALFFGWMFGLVYTFSILAASRLFLRWRCRVARSHERPG